MEPFASNGRLKTGLIYLEKDLDVLKIQDFNICDLAVRSKRRNLNVQKLRNLKSKSVEIFEN